MMFTMQVVESEILFAEVVGHKTCVSKRGIGKGLVARRFDAVLGLGFGPWLRLIRG